MEKTEEKRWKKQILSEGKVGGRFEIDPRFELYQIIIQQMPADRIPNRICLNSSLRDDILYERKDGDPPLPIGTPIRFSGPSRPPVCLDPLYIVFGETDWYWLFVYGRYPSPGRGPQKYEVSDEDKTAKATIMYERIRESLEAYLEITLSFSGNTGSGYRIGGEIGATTNGNPTTKRILLYDDHTNHIRVKADTPLPLNRSVVAMSPGSMLHLHFVNLTLTGETHKIQLNLIDAEIDAPDHPRKVSYVQIIESQDMVIKRRHQGEGGLLDEGEGGFLPHKIEVSVQVTWDSDDSECFQYDEKEETDQGSSDDSDDAESLGPGSLFD